MNFHIFNRFVKCLMYYNFDLKEMRPTMVINDSDYINIPVNLERHLKAFNDNINATERHQILWHTWCQNKRWLTHLLEYVLPSFQTYSMHDKTHAESVIHNMELVLGEERIKSLSATDTFMLLHIAYIHDIGMCITEADKKDIIKSEEFVELIEQAKSSSDPQIRSFASKMDKNNISRDNEDFFENRLEIFKAVSYFIAEFRRKEHGQVSSNRLKDIVLSQNSLGNGFSISEVPIRIFFQIAECAATHTVWGFKPILDLPQESNGFAHDFIHPRFIAILLQVSDALDIENGRFHSLIHSFYGVMNNASEMHFDKHQSIRQLNITNKIISITADCKSQDVIRLLRNECNYLEKLLKEANYHWSEIAPPNFNGCLPFLLPPKLLYNGHQIPQELINAKFNLTPEKSFRLIEGINVYSDNFPYIREIIQNAIDATKLQVWHDYKGSLAKREDAFDSNEDEASVILPKKIRKMLPKYPIEVELEIVVLNKDDSDSYSKYEDINNDFSIPDNKFGVLVSIQDHGIGISADDIISISDVGTSHSAQNPYLKEMPSVLQTTGKFGIGLQSIFQISNTFTAITKTHSEESYEITFSSGSGSSSGVINTMLINNSEDIPYGTQMSFVVPSTQKIERQFSLNTWKGENPFSDDYIDQKNLKDAEELLSQIVHYLNGLFGQTLFPIVVMTKNLFSKPSPIQLKEEKIILRDFQSNKEKIKQDNLFENICWAFQIDKSSHYKIQSVLPNKDYYIFDTKKVRLLLWSEKWHTFASVSGERLYKNMLHIRDKKAIDSEHLKIYYKGITTKFNLNINDNLLLVDYLDIKAADAGKILMLNREGLTREGQNYVESIYNNIIDLVIEVYADIANKYSLLNSEKKIDDYSDLVNEDSKRLDEFDFLPDFARNFYNDTDIIEHDNIDKENITKAIFMFSVIAHHASVSLCLKNKDQECLASNLIKCPWDILLKKIAAIYDNLELETLSIPVNSVIENYGQDIATSISFPQLLLEIESYGILSYREERSQTWKHSIFNISDTNLDTTTKKSNKEGYYNNLQPIISKRIIDMQRFLKGFMLDTNSYYLNFEVAEFLVNWTLKNTPTEALFSAFDFSKGIDDTSVNVRFNILSKSKIDEVFFDNNTILLLIKRIIERAENDHAKVFSTSTFYPFKCLSIDKQKFNDNICQVNCGVLPAYMTPQMLLPFDFDFVKKFFEDNHITLTPNAKLKNDYKNRLIELSKEKENWHVTICKANPVLINLPEDKFNNIRSDLLDNKSNLDFIEFSNNFRTKKAEYKDDYSELLQLAAKYLEINDKPLESSSIAKVEELLKKIQENKYFILLAESLFWANEGAAISYLNQVLIKDDVLEKFILKWRERDETNNIINFTMNNAESHLMSHRYRMLYETLFNKIFNALEQLYKEDIEMCISNIVF